MLRFASAILLALFLTHLGFVSSGRWIPQERGSGHKATQAEVPSFLGWVFSAATLDFGKTSGTGPPVAKAFSSRLGSTLALMLLALLFALFVALPLAALAAAREAAGKRLPMSRIGPLLLLSVPTFIIAYLLVEFGKGETFEKYKVMWAALVVATAMVPTWFFHAKAKFDQVFALEFVEFQKISGTPPTTIFFKHVLPNSLLPLLTIGAYLPVALVEGSLIVERIFNLDGLGFWVFQGFVERDHAVVMFAVLISGILLSLGIAASEFASKRVFAELAEVKKEKNA